MYGSLCWGKSDLGQELQRAPKCIVHSVGVSLNRDKNYRDAQMYGLLCWGKSE